MGELALPKLKEAARSDDPEISMRAKQAMEKIQPKTAEKPQRGPHRGIRGGGLNDLDALFEQIDGLDRPRIQIE